MTFQSEYFALLWDGDDIARPRTILRRRPAPEHSLDRKSLLAGPRGVIKLETTWQVTDDGYRLTTIIPMGGN